VAALLRFEWTACSGTGGRLPPVYPVDITGICTQAGEFRQHKAHEHGSAHLNVALDRNNLYLELTSPAANIVGFEHRPRTREQKTAVQQAIKALRAGENLFALPSVVGGRLVKSSVKTDLTGDPAHEHDEAPPHEHEEGSTNAGHEAETPDHEEHQGEDEHERHSEFKAEYHFLCNKPEKLAYLDVTLFRYFAGVEHIEVQLLTAIRQTALELTAKKSKIDFYYPGH